MANGENTLDEDVKRPEIPIGEEVYTEDGTLIGTVREIKEDGVFVTTREGQAQLSDEHTRSTPELGSGELMWRCMNCGEMGEIEGGLPERCPNCDVPKEELMYWTED